MFTIGDLRVDDQKGCHRTTGDFNPDTTQMVFSFSGEAGVLQRRPVGARQELERP